MYSLQKVESINHFSSLRGWHFAVNGATGGGVRRGQTKNPASSSAFKRGGRAGAAVLTVEQLEAVADAWLNAEGRA